MLVLFDQLNRVPL